jgi:hypothetical protein
MPKMNYSESANARIDKKYRIDARVVKIEKRDSTSPHDPLDGVSGPGLFKALWRRGAFDILF